MWINYEMRKLVNKFIWEKYSSVKFILQKPIFYTFQK